MRATLSARLAVLASLAMVGAAGWSVPTAQAWLPGGSPLGQVEVPPPLPLPNPGPLPAPNPIDPPCQCPHEPPPPPPCHETPEPSALLLGVVGVGLFGLCSLRRRR